MMSVTAIIQGAQNWSRSLPNFGPSHMSLGIKHRNLSQGYVQGFYTKITI